MKIFGGVEGGATHSTLILYNENAEGLAEVEGPSTNLFQIGMAETCHRIAQMNQEALTKAGFPKDTKLESLGLSLSGCEVEETNTELAKKLMELYPDLVHKLPKVCSDTIGTLLTASDQGGVVLIAGTGSNSLLINPDGTEMRCGGWGHVLGDEGSAWWISRKAMKFWFDEEDNLIQPPYSSEKIAEAIKSYFGIKDRFGLLTYCYDKFEKPHFAGVCKNIAQQAEMGDPLSKHVFNEAGKALAMHITALSRKMESSLKNSLSVVCIGSVWKSWNLMKDGFVNELQENSPEIRSYKLVKLKVPMATGACYLAAGSGMNKKYTENTEVFFQYPA